VKIKNNITDRTNKYFFMILSFYFINTIRFVSTTFPSQISEYKYTPAGIEPPCIVMLSFPPVAESGICLITLYCGFFPIPTFPEAFTKNVKTMSDKIVFFIHKKFNYYWNRLKYYANVVTKI